MGEIIKIQTGTKEDLFELGRWLAQSIPCDRFMDRSRPVIILMNGCSNSGKSIFPDVAREVFFEHAAMTGDKRYSELWTGEYRQRILQLGFINALFGDCYIKQQMESERSEGGILFLSNFYRTNLAALFYPPAVELEIKTYWPEGLPRKVFNRVAYGDPWNRNITMEICDESLLKDLAFKDFLRLVQDKKESGAYSLRLPELS